MAYLLVLLTVAALAYGVLVLLPSRLKTRRLERERDALEQRLANLRRGIERRQAETAALAEDPWAVERALRRQLDYLGSGEQALTGSHSR